MAEVTVKPYQPNLVPVDYDPFYEATSADKPAFQPTAKLIAKDLFNLEPRAFNPTLNFKPEGLVEGLKELGKSFMEGFNKSGGAMLKSYAEALENQYVPEGAVKFDDEGKYYDKDGKELPVQRRPNLLPVTRAAKEGEGWFGSNFEGAMPALADVWNTLGGAGGKATLGAGPSLRPALKYMDKIYKAKPGEQHLDAIPAELRATFEKQALSGEDISNFNFGFINHKGHFLQREDALKYAIDHGILDPNDAKYGTLVTTMLNQSGGEGKLLSQGGNYIKDKKYPMAPHNDWWGQRQFKQQGGRLEMMPPDEFLNKSRPLKIDESSRETIDELKKHIIEGKKLDPLNLQQGGKEDGRHRAIAAKELGIKEVPVINFRAESGGEGKLVSQTANAIKDQIPEYLYHATFEPYLKGIKKEGLKGGKNLNYTDSKPDLVYLSRDPENARSYAEVSENVPEEYLDKIKILKIPTKNLDLSKLNIDKNVIENKGDTLEYKGIINPKSILFNQSGGEGKIASTFFSALEDNLNKINQNKASGDQWLSTLQNAKGVKGEEIEWTGLKDFLAGKKNVTKGEIEDFLKQNSVNINDVWRGEMKFDKKSKYAIPEVIRAAKEAGDTPGDLHLTLANDGNAYRALMKKFPELNGNEDWAEVVAKSVFGGDSMPKGTAKYEKYQLPGAKNYRELLMTLPEKQRNDVTYAIRGENGLNVPAKAKTKAEAIIEAGGDPRRVVEISNSNDITNYRSSHWDEPNILAHMRMNDRTIDGKKSLHLEEIQSDWHQQGREKGYNNNKDPYPKEYVESYRQEMLEKPEFKGKELSDKDVIDYFGLRPKENLGGVPDAPFKKTWHELALKRAIREAAENGYERLSWTPGEAQAARYDLSKQVDKIAVPMVNQDGTRSVRIDAKQGTPFKLMVNKEGIVDGIHSASQFSGKPLSDIVGKEMAEKIMKLNKPDEFSGDGLKVGGKGMKGFYDQIIPKSVEKIAKEFGVKVQKGEIGSDKIPDNFDIEHTGSGWRVVDKSLNEGQGTFIGPIHRSGAEAEKWLKEQGHLKQPIFYIDIPPAMRQAVMQKGQPLFSGTPTLVSIDYEPEFEK